MSQLITLPADADGADAGAAERRCQQLEAGCILFLSETPLRWSDGALASLRDEHEPAGFHKNLTYCLDRDRIGGLGWRGGAAAARLGPVLRSYAEQITAWLATVLAPYARAWRVDLTSFRPSEEAARQLPWRSRNDLLHIDAFPARPTHGARILRVFTNVHPTRPRRWVTADPLERSLDVMRAFPGFAGVVADAGTPWRRLQRRLWRWGWAVGLPLPQRSRYDECMLRLHDCLKRDGAFQHNCRRDTWDFPARSSWVLFTDTVPHAALAGRYALEQTFIVPHHALLAPERSPLTLLERIVGAPLVEA